VLSREGILHRPHPKDDAQVSFSDAGNVLLPVGSDSVATIGRSLWISARIEILLVSLGKNEGKGKGMDYDCESTGY